jgi:hypothetical protein
MSELEEMLFQKARRVLRNPLEVTEDVVILSLQEAKELTENKPIAQTLLLDLALLRVKLNLKIELTEFEEKSILSILKRADAISINELNEVVNHTVLFGTRSSIWDI